jgi:acylphosphatase
MKNVKIKIKGSVKDTGYLYFAKQMAEQFDVNGYVRYSDANSVFIEAEGNPKALNELIDYYKIGCYGSNVSAVEITEGKLMGYATFEIMEYSNNLQNI